MKKRFLTIIISMGLVAVVNAQGDEVRRFKEVNKIETAEELKSVKNVRANIHALVNSKKKQERTVHAHLKWEKHFKTAIKIAKKEKKPIFVLFTGTDWCMPCRKLEKKVLETQKFKNYAEKYFVLYKADFPRNKDLVDKQDKKYNNSLKKKFKQRSFPTIIVIDDNGNAYGKREGIYTWDSYYDFFEKVVMNVKSKKFI